MRNIKFRFRYDCSILGLHFVIKTLTKLGNENLFMEDYEYCGQFTGLKDKNGKEIYEGDIVKVEKEVHDEHNMYDNGTLRVCKNEVIFSQGMFGVMGWGGRPLSEWDSIEVIGNIYENPELLSAKEESLHKESKK